MSKGRKREEKKKQKLGKMDGGDNLNKKSLMNGVGETKKKKNRKPKSK